MSDSWVEPCVYCSSDPHSDGCPLVTGVFLFVRDEFPHGLRCGECGCVVGEGDSYASVPLGDSGDTVLLTCVGCHVLVGVR